MAKKSVSAEAVPASFVSGSNLGPEVQVPRAILGDNKHCIALPVGNDFTFGPNFRVRKGEIVVFEAGKAPSEGDVVVMFSEGRTPVARRCDIAPNRWSGEDSGFVHAHGEDLFSFRRRDFDFAGAVVARCDSRGVWSRIEAGAAMRIAELTP